MFKHSAIHHIAEILIVANAGVMAAGLIDHSHEEIWDTADMVFLALFTIELAWRVRQQRSAFFRDPWLVADLIIITVALLPSAGNGVMIARVGRLARAVHLTRHVGHLRIAVWLGRHVAHRIPASV
ncbi:ion transporter [Mycobacterium sp. 94-17]|uniref:ion transporter n=1 Tax=Mycobacterium sp. 94-17 TaxID=2986147 RepID=UPI002D1F6DCA|nr:ion transporter [Mycobacterium sp. 94-17]MEB4210964.1 ion transporter [Mycobacterium sp. 94-17]